MSTLKSRFRDVAGSGIVEALVAIMLLSVVLGAMISVLIQQQRFYLVANDAANTTGVVERLETVMLTELMPLRPSAGDILHAGPDSIYARVFRGVYSICKKDGKRWELRKLTRAPLIRTDTILVYTGGTKGSISDDRWLVAPVKEFKDDNKVCPSDNTPSWQIEVTSDFDPWVPEIKIGYPVRIFDHASFWLTTQDGSWFLYTSEQGQPKVVSGPLAPADSAAGSVLRFRYLDAAGNTTATLTDIARIEIELAAVGAVPMRRGGSPLSRSRDIAIKLRNAAP